MARPSVRFLARLALRKHLIESLELEVAGDLVRHRPAACEHLKEILVVHADLAGLRRDGQAFAFHVTLDQLQHLSIGDDGDLAHRVRLTDRGIDRLYTDC